MSKTGDESENLLIGGDKGGMDFASKKNASSAAYDDDDLRPSSSRVKKVLNWDPQLGKFHMDQKHMNELREHHIKDPAHWRQFEEWIDKFNVADHPEKKGKSCCMGVLLWTVGVTLLLLVFYLLFIILQLALFNLIMLVVMGVLWYKLSQIFKAVITRILDNGRKKNFKAYVKEIKNEKWLERDYHIEIQENDEGRWIEIHLNETADDREDEVIEEEENE